MNHNSQAHTILIAEDNLEDRLLIKEVFHECNQECELVFVQDGIEALRYLHHQSPHPGVIAHQRPDLILLDLNMPRKDGRETLIDLKSDPNLRAIPVVVMTVSSLEEDVLQAYQQGAAGYIIKPDTIIDMIEVVKVLTQYWFEVVELSRGDQVKLVQI